MGPFLTRDANWGTGWVSRKFDLNKVSICLRLGHLVVIVFYENVDVSELVQLLELGVLR